MTYLTPHGFSHQELNGIDQLVNLNLFERIRRVPDARSTAPSATFGGTNNVNSTLQSGHTWQVLSGSNAAGSLNYTGDYAITAMSSTGTIATPQCIKVTTSGASVGVTVCTNQSTRPTAINFSANKYLLRIWLKIPDSTSYANLQKIQIKVGSGASGFLNFNFCQPMGDQSVASTAFTEYMRPGEWVALTLGIPSFGSVGAGTIDWTAIQDISVAVNSNAGGATTVLVGGVDVIASSTAFPGGVVSLTFDDGYNNQLNLALPKMMQYGMRGTCYVIQDLLGQSLSVANGSSSGYLTKANLDYLSNLGWEIATHDWLVANHNATNGWQSLSQATLINDWGLFKGWMHQNGYRGFDHVALPKGMWDSTTMNLLKQQFVASRTTNNRSVETLPVGDPLRLRCQPMNAGAGTVYTTNTTVGSIEWYIDQVVANGGWLILMVHDLVTASPGSVQMLQSDFNTIVDYLFTKGVPVKTVGDVLGL